MLHGSGSGSGPVPGSDESGVITSSFTLLLGLSN